MDHLQQQQTFIEYKWSSDKMHTMALNQYCLFRQAKYIAKTAVTEATSV